MKAKLLLTFPRDTLKLLEKTRSIYTAIKINPSFKEMSPEFTALSEQLPAKMDELRVAYDEALSHDSNKIAKRNQLSEELKDLLVQVSRHVENIAKGDVKILESSGFELVRDKTRKINYPLIAALILLQHGKESGTMSVKGKRLPGAWRYETYITDGDPSQEQNWRLCDDSPHCSRIEISGLTPGMLYWVRMRGIWIAGPGPWSTATSLRAL